MIELVRSLKPISAAVEAVVELALDIHGGFERLPGDVRGGIIDVMILEKSLARSSNFKTVRREKYAGIAARCARRPQLVDVTGHGVIGGVLQTHGRSLRRDSAHHQSIARSA